MLYNVPLNARLNTSSLDTTCNPQEPKFQEKSCLTFNGALSNIMKTEHTGFPTTVGNSLTIDQLYDGGEEAGAMLTDLKNKNYDMPFKWLLTEKIECEIAQSGTVTSQAIYNDKIYTIYLVNDIYYLALQNLDGTTISVKKIMDPEDPTSNAHSAVLSSCMTLENSPKLIVSKIENTFATEYDSHVYFYELDDDNYFAKVKYNKFTPLGKLGSATVIKEGLITYLYAGCEDTDARRRCVFVYNLTDGTQVTQLNWFGTVSAEGMITGEPIPDPDVVKVYTEMSNGVIRWDTWNDGASQIQWPLLAGYRPYNNDPTYKIIIKTVATTEITRVNMSQNDTADGTDTAPKRHFFSNYADDNGVYWAYGKGWSKNYVRTYVATNVTEAYIYTLGCTTTAGGQEMERRESIKAKVTAASYNFPFTSGELNKLVYTVGNTNIGTNSLLMSIPFTVPLIRGKESHFKLLVNGLSVAGVAFKKSLFTVVGDHTEYNIQLTETGYIMMIDNILFYIDKTSDARKLRIKKVADYNFITNVLDNNNYISEDRSGNITIFRTAIPYNNEHQLSIGEIILQKNTITNDTWYQAAGNNVQLTEKNCSTSLLTVAITLPIALNAADRKAFISEAINQRFPIMKPVLGNFYDVDESIDSFYTLRSAETSIKYKTTNRKTDDPHGDYRYDLWGKPVNNVLKEGTQWYITTSSVMLPIPIGATVEGVNYITPTVKLLDNMRARLVSAQNRTMMGYLLSNTIYYGDTIFTIYGSNYYYDGQAIYYLGGGDTIVNTFVCYALGMKYLSNSGSEAYFYSDWEKRLFIFTGSNTMQPIDFLSNKGFVRDAVYSSKEQVLYLLTDEEDKDTDELIIRTPQDIGSVDVDKGAILLGTCNGVAVTYGDDINASWRIFSPVLGTPDKFVLATQFLGSDAAVSNFAYTDIVLFATKEEQKTPKRLKLKLTTLNGKEMEVETKDVVINPTDWQGRNVRIRMTPKYPKGNSFKLAITTDDLIHITFIGTDITDFSETGTGAKIRA